MRLLNFAPVALAVMMLSGCGYHTLSSAAHLPPSVKTVAVPIFRNSTQQYKTEVAMTQAVIRELGDRTSLRVLPGKEDADATLEGTIISESIQPLTYKTQTTASIAGAGSSFTSSFLITIKANVVLVGRDHQVLYQHDGYSFHQQYETTTDLNSFIEENSPAVERLSRDFAAALVSDILESY